jgi:Phage portal protein
MQVARELVGMPRPWVLDMPATHVFDTAPAPVDRVITAMRSGLGSSIGRTEAMRVAAVQRGRNELCAIGTLPLRLYRGLSVVADAPLFRQFDPSVPNVVMLAMLVEDLAFEKVAYWEKTGFDFEGFPVSVRRREPENVSLKRPDGGPRPGDDRWVWVRDPGDREWQQLAAGMIIRFDSPNPGILTANAPAIRRALALDRVASMYADNPQLREWFTDADGIEDGYSDDRIDEFLADYLAARRASPVGWIPKDVVRADVASPSPRDLTLVELQRQATIEIANGLGVDPEDLGVSTTSRTYQNADDRRKDKINRVYGPYMSAITDRLSMGDVTRRGYSVRFDLTDYLKSDPVTQATYWRSLMDMGVTDADEIRGWAGLPGKAPTAAPAVHPELAARLAGRFAADRPAFTFDAGDFETPAAAPVVDESARTITGLAVPYGMVTEKYGMKMMFMPGSLEYSEPARMAHLMDHVTPVGYHRSITDSAAGPVVELAVLDSPEGSPAKVQRDQLLYDAAHGLYSGLSVGVGYSMDPEDGDVEIGDDGVMRIVRATWRETSTTYMPAFDDARVTKVAASRTGGNPMDPCQHCGHRHAANIACATFRAQLLAQHQPSPAPVALPSPAPVDQVAAPDPALAQAFAAFVAAGPTLVSPHQGPAVVVEPDPYRFDRRGNIMPGTHDFSSDLFIGWKQGGGGDKAARDRAEAWVSEKFAVTPANVTALNYPANRPDLYVDQLDYRYPLYDAAYTGPLTAVTPFVVPKFNSSSGLVADHVTGTEPTPGAFTATSQTITPTPVSGKVEFTREAYDQGGNPQVSGLIWRQMLRAWYEGLEAFVQAQLIANAASIADLTITTAAVDAALDQAITDALVPLQFIRGGDVFDTVFTQVDLYKAMTKAKDSAGRRLYPQLGAQNAVGSVSRGYTAIDAHGKIWLPAWATAASGTVAASSWMFDREVVNLWVSTPSKIDLEWRVAWVDIGIWGYKAFAITDFSRTREISYDPV